MTSGSFWSSHNGETQLTIYQGDVLETLRQMDAESVHCVVTSPPYWGLRDYKLEPQVWGGDAGCKHEWGEESCITMSPHHLDESVVSTRGGGHKKATIDATTGAFCRCGAWRGSLGLEPTPDLYVQHLVEIFREVRRVLRKDGTVWLVLGDSYAGSGRGPSGENGFQNAEERQGFTGGTDPRGKRANKTDAPKGYKAKDLIGIPWRVAFALQSDGWWLRSDIVWSKPNPMPESVTDRPTKAHEYVFLLTKSATYFYDADAVREPHDNPEFIARSQVQVPHDESPDGGFTRRWDPAIRQYNPLGRNRRTVWTIPTQPFPEAHFATYPQKLVEPCVMAGCPKGGTILDPFLGSGTTLLVAQRLGRNGIGIELSEDYCRMAVKRIEAEHSQIRLGIT